MTRPGLWQPQPIRVFLEQAQTVQRWVVPGFIPYEGLVVISGPRKLARKTLLADILSVVITSNLTVDVMRCIHPGPVIYFEEEGTPGATSDKWRGIEKSLKVDLDSNEDLYYSFRPRVLLDDAQWAAAIIGAVRKIKPRLCIFDALTYMHKADENKTHEMRAVVDTLQEVRCAGTACLFLVHTNAEGSRDASLDIDLSVRGSRLILDAYDVHVGLRRARSSDPLHCTIRQREGSEREYQLNWDLQSSWDPETDAEKIEYLWPHFRDCDDIKRDERVARVLAATPPTPKGATASEISTGARLRTDQTIIILEGLEREGRVSASMRGRGRFFRRRS